MRKIRRKIWANSISGYKSRRRSYTKTYPYKDKCFSGSGSFCISASGKGGRSWSRREIL